MRSILNNTEGSKGVSAVEEEVGLRTALQAEGTLWVQASHRDKLAVFEGQPKGQQEVGESAVDGSQRAKHSRKSLENF